MLLNANGDSIANMRKEGILNGAIASDPALAAFFRILVFWKQ
jgi:hypothetical protein